MLALKKISLQIDLCCCFVLFVFKFISFHWVQFPDLGDCLVPRHCCSLKAGVGRNSKSRGRVSLYCTSSDFHHFELAVSLQSAVDGVNRLVTLPLIYQIREKCLHQFTYIFTQADILGGSESLNGWKCFHLPFSKMW